MTFIRSTAAALIVSTIWLSTAFAETLTPSNIARVLTTKAHELGFKGMSFRSHDCNGAQETLVCDVTESVIGESNAYTFLATFYGLKTKRFHHFRLNIEAGKMAYKAAALSVVTNLLNNSNEGLSTIGPRYIEQITRAKEKADAGDDGVGVDEINFGDVVQTVGVSTYAGISLTIYRNDALK
jgi:hypothetical protein